MIKQWNLKNALGRLGQAGPGLAAGQVGCDLERAPLSACLYFQEKTEIRFFFFFLSEIARFLNVGTNWKKKKLNIVDQTQTLGHVICNFWFKLKIFPQSALCNFGFATVTVKKQRHVYL